MSVPLSGYTRPLASRASLNVNARVTSAANADACKSIIRRTCSPNESGTPNGASGISRSSPETLRASGAFPGLMFPDPILTDVEAEKIHTRLIAFQGVANATFSLV